MADRDQLTTEQLRRILARLESCRKGDLCELCDCTPAPGAESICPTCSRCSRCHATGNCADVYELRALARERAMHGQTENNGGRQG